MLADYVTPSRLEDALKPFPTREELHQVIAPLATKEELRKAIAPLATKEELRKAIAPLATKEELGKAIAPLATKEEMKTAIAEAIAPLATKKEMKTAITEAIAPLATKDELKTVFASIPTLAQIRHEFNLSVEQFRTEFGFLHDAYKAVDERQKTFEKETTKRFDAQSTRIDNIENEVATLLPPTSPTAVVKGGKRR